MSNGANYPHHPAAAIFQLLEEDELLALADSIRKNGLRNPIALYEGKIVDGRNRMAACLLAGVKPRFVNAEITGLVADYVHDQNYHRRQLTDGARQLAAGRYKEQAAKEAKERQRQTLKKGSKKPDVAALPPRETGKARDQAGEKFRFRRSVFSTRLTRKRCDTDS